MQNKKKLFKIILHEGRVTSLQSWKGVRNAEVNIFFIFILTLLQFMYHLSASKKCFSLSVLQRHETNIITFVYCITKEKIVTFVL